MAATGPAAPRRGVLGLGLAVVGMGGLALLAHMAANRVEVESGTASGAGPG